MTSHSSFDFSLSRSALTAVGCFMLPVLLGVSVAACGGRADESDEPPEAVNTAARGTGLQYFHRDAANLAFDHGRLLFAIQQRLPGSNAVHGSCGTLSSSPVAAGTRLEYAPGAHYPSPHGGAVAVKDVYVKSLDSTGLVMHVTMLNDTELDEAWLRGLGSACEGDCVPSLDACASLAK